MTEEQSEYITNQNFAEYFDYDDLVEVYAEHMNVSGRITDINDYMIVVQEQGHIGYTYIAMDRIVAIRSIPTDAEVMEFVHAQEEEQ